VIPDSPHAGVNYRHSRISMAPCDECVLVTPPDVLVSIEVLEHAVGLAEDQAAELVIVRHELLSLTERGSITALLKSSRSPRACRSSSAA
jgi:hypothetical protein